MESPPPYRGSLQLTVTPEAQRFLNSAANWARFLGILAFSAVFIVGMGTYILTLISSNIYKAQEDALSELFMMTTVSIIIFATMTVIYFYALYKILKFSSTVKRAIKYNDSNTLTKAFEHLKSHYKSMGIMMITGILLYILYSIVIGIIMIYGMAVFVNTF